MNKLSRMAIASLALATVSAPASAFLENWSIDLTGTGASRASVNEWLNFDGYSFVQDNFSDATHFSFADNGVFRFTSTDQGQVIGLDIFPGYEMTMLFQGVTGSGTLNGTTGTITFTPGGSLTVYSGNGATRNWTETTQGDGVYYGANDGTLIGSFTIVSGSGSIDNSAVPNGPITIVFATTQAVPCGYWFDSSGTDLCTKPVGQLLSFTTTNASRTTNAPVGIPLELVCNLANFNCGNTPPGTPYDNLTTGPNIYFVVGNNGQFRLDERVPEPGTIALLGLGLAGLGLGRRFRRA